MTTPQEEEFFDLDFTKAFAEETPVPAPVTTPAQEKKFEEEAIIGESNLTSNGYFVRLNESAPKRPARNTPAQVLVVEDDMVTATLLLRILSAHGFKVRHAANREAIVSGLKLLPDLVLLDVLLPDANGFDILSRIRTHPTLKDLPVLMLTSLGSLDDILKGLKHGANGYLTKPAKSNALVEAIRKLLA